MIYLYYCLSFLVPTWIYLYARQWSPKNEKTRNQGKLFYQLLYAFASIAFLDLVYSLIRGSFRISDKYSQSILELGKDTSGFLVMAVAEVYFVVGFFISAQIMRKRLKNTGDKA